MPGRSVCFTIESICLLKENAVHVVKNITSTPNQRGFFVVSAIIEQKFKDEFIYANWDFFLEFF